MSSHVLAPSTALTFLGLSCLALSPGCHRPLEVQKGDYLLHASPEPAPQSKALPKSRPVPPPDPDYHPE
jgi:hypothetical protein